METKGIRRILQTYQAYRDYSNYPEGEELYRLVSVERISAAVAASLHIRPDTSTPGYVFYRDYRPMDRP